MKAIEALAGMQPIARRGPQIYLLTDKEGKYGRVLNLEGSVPKLGPRIFVESIVAMGGWTPTKFKIRPEWYKNAEVVDLDMEPADKERLAAIAKHRKKED